MVFKVFNNILVNFLSYFEKYKASPFDVMICLDHVASIISTKKQLVVLLFLESDLPIRLHHVKFLEGSLMTSSFSINISNLRRLHDSEYKATRREKHRKHKFYLQISRETKNH